MPKAGVSAKWDNAFEPYENRNLIHGLTRLESLTNLLTGSIGTGIFALPEAFYFAGMANGIVWLIIISIFSLYCLHVLIRSQYYLCKYKNVGVLTYADSMEVAFEVGPDCFKPYARLPWHMVNIIYIIFQCGVLCVYVIFIATTLKSICDEYTAKPIYLYVYTLIIITPCASVICIKNLKLFAPFSLVANILTVMTLAVLAYYISSNLPPFSSRPAFGKNLVNHPLALGTALFAIQSVPVVTTIENAVIDAKYFVAPLGTLNMGFLVITLIYIIAGIMGYWKYGPDIESSIILNLPPEDKFVQVINGVYCLALTISYGLQGIIPVKILWNNYWLPKLEEYEVSDSKKTICNYVLRLGLCLITFTISLLIPFLGPIISLIGGLCLSIIGIIFPALLELCALWQDGFGKFRWIFWKDILMCAVGLLGLVVTMYSAINDITIDLSNTNSFEI